MSSTNLCDDSIRFITSSHSKILDHLKNLTIELSPDEINSIFQDLLNNIKFLRNICAKGTKFQFYIASLPNFFDSIISLVWTDNHNIFTILNIKSSDALKLLLWQLLANLCAKTCDNNSETQKLVWTKCGTTLISILKKDLTTFTDIQLIIINNLIKTDDNFFLKPKEFFELIITVWSNFLENKNNEMNLEFMHIVFQDFLCNKNRITPLYGPLDAEKRILVLKYICAYIRNGSPNGTIQENLMEYFSKEFKKKSDCILKTNINHLNELHSKEVMALLEVIALSTGDDIYINIYRNDHSLFLNVGSLLYALNEIGKNSENNMFTPMEKLIEVAPNSCINEDFQNEISYQLRSQLVRTLANLLYKNHKNQTYAREMKIISAILNCTRIDARNPMMKEWSILAIRNLCENCRENQELITQLSKISDAPNDILTELNLEMGSLRIKPDA